jgi:hypothetical protein
MQYFALLISKERDLTPEEGAAEMAAYEAFHSKASSAIRAGDALAPAATAVRITGGPDAPIITDGPFAEGVEVAGGYYVFEAENLDDALALARDIPAAKHGVVEIWSMASSLQPQPLQGTNWIALLLEPPEKPVAPGTPEWKELAVEHQKFGAAAGQHIKSGAGLDPPSTATTVRVRDGEVLIRPLVGRATAPSPGGDELTPGRNSGSRTGRPECPGPSSSTR